MSSVRFSPNLERLCFIKMTLRRLLIEPFRCSKRTNMMNNYEEVIGAVDRIIATYSPGNILTVMEKQAMHFILTLLVSWLQLFSGPDCLEDAIHHICTFVPCLPDEDRTMFANVLDSLIKQCFDYFGVTGKSEGIPPPPRGIRFFFITAL